MVEEILPYLSSFYPPTNCEKLSDFTKAAEEKNAENLLVITEAPELVQAYEQNIRAHAAHAHPSERQTSGPSAATPFATTSRDGDIHGTKHSKIYHLPGCPGY